MARLPGLLLLGLLWNDHPIINENAEEPWSQDGFLGQNRPNGRLSWIAELQVKAWFKRTCDPEKEVDYRLPPEVDPSSSNLEIPLEVAEA